MNEDKLRKLLAAARREPPPAPPEDFTANVLRAVRLEPPIALPADSFLNDLDWLFPRVALAALAVIILCVTADYALAAAGLPGLGEGFSLFTAQWLFL
jgi:hypothetical protein